MNKDIQAFLTGYSGYNGGDIGSPETPAIWCCGIEWGGNMDCDELSDYIKSGEWKQISGFEVKGENAQTPYDRVLCKLLCVMSGGQVKDYYDFAVTNQIWHKGVKSGHFKMNLYPIKFKDTDHARWNSRLTELLGFADKSEYMRWCRLFRFPVINRLVQKHQPKAVLCFGTSYEDDFNLAFSDGYRSFHSEIIDKLPVKWKFNQNGSLIVVLPFPNVPRYGLQRDRSIQDIGKFLLTLLSENKAK
ncbi:hypothetical protein RYD26_00185 [Pasteurellaceae bacterium LIM206]|nr:hypothetical protein [Pasteurellaceae bacterium LIM206]